MQAILFFINQYRNFILFLFLEAVSLLLLVSHHQGLQPLFSNAVTEYSSTLLSTSENVWEYFKLKKVNAELLRENEYLHYLLSKEQQKKNARLDPIKDSAIVKKYNFLSAQVVHNTTHRQNNYITINKGSSHGIKPGMGVMASLGLVGRVKSCSSNFSTVISLLHSESLIAVEVKRTKIIGSLKWNGKNPTYAQVHHVPSHFDILVGDTIVTSGYNAVFPSGVVVGIVEKVDKKYDETFYDIDIKLSAGYSALSYVYVVQNLLQEEQTALERDTTIYSEIPEVYISDARRQELKEEKERIEKERQQAVYDEYQNLLEKERKEEEKINNSIDSLNNE